MNIRRDVFQAIADPTRRSILMLLATGSLGAGAIANNYESSRQTISKHIQILFLKFRFQSFVYFKNFLNRQ